jgi:protein-tyrosine phosphatase
VSLRGVFWINGANVPHLAIVLCPRGGNLLSDEMRRIKANGVDTVVSLLEPFEAAMLGLSDEQAAASEAGLDFLSFPIRDTQVPFGVSAFSHFIDNIAGRLKAGEHIGVHCRGSIGRATVTGACALIHIGWSPREALDAIAETRGAPVPNTEEQERWILNYRARK